MDDDLLNLDLDTSDLRPVFGMLTAYVLLPASNHTFAREVDELDLTGRARTLAAARALWHLMGTASERDHGLENVVTKSRHVADDDFAMLPDTLRLARALDDELEATDGKAISAHLVAEIATDGTRALGALAYFLRARALCSTRWPRRVEPASRSCSPRPASTSRSPCQRRAKIDPLLPVEY